MLFRVSVHSTITKLWVGNNSVTMVPGSQNYVLSVYALFDADTTVCDITSHPYLTYNSTSTSVATVDSKGRLTSGSNLEGVTSVTVSAPGGVQSLSSVQVTVVAASSDTVLTQLDLSKNAAAHNLLILAEGFAADDKADFDKYAKLLKSEMFGELRCEPFLLLANSWNVWMKFEPSMESGISVGPPLTERFFPEDPNQVGVGGSGSGQYLFQAKDSRYGLMYSARLGERPFQVGNPPSDSFGAGVQWVAEPADAAYRSIGQDLRRINPELPLARQMDAYFNTLTDQQGNQIGSAWMSHTDGGQEGVDFKRVVFIVCDQRTAGTTFNIGIAATPSEQSVILVPSPIPGPPYDHHGSVPASPESFTDIVVHELGHSLWLGDEYNDNANSATLPNAQRTEIESKYINLTTFLNQSNGDDTPPKPSAVFKWNCDRMILSSATQQVTSPLASGPLTVSLSPNDAARWTNFTTKSSLAYIRPSILAIAGVAKGFASAQLGLEFDPTKYAYGPYSWQIAGETLTLTPAVVSAARNPNYPNADLPLGSVVYIPKLDSNGNILTLISGPVLQFINANGPFPLGTGPNLGHTEVPPSAIHLLTYPSQMYEVIGLYTGGGTWTHGVYRPSGMCRMRDQYNHTAFCFVCKYLIVDQIDPSQLADLDKQYPGG